MAAMNHERMLGMLKKRAEQRLEREVNREIARERDKRQLERSSVTRGCRQKFLRRNGRENRRRKEDGQVDKGDGSGKGEKNRGKELVGRMERREGGMKWREREHNGGREEGEAGENASCRPGLRKSGCRVVVPFLHFSKKIKATATRAYCLLLPFERLRGFVHRG